MASNAKRISRDEDIISSMPVDILLQILSRMDTKSASVTSILSRQWRYLPALLPCFRLTLETKTTCRLGSHRRLNQRLATFLNVFLDFANSQTHPNMRSLVVEFDYFKIAHKELLQICIMVALSGKLEHLEVLNKGAHYEFPSHCFTGGVNNHLQSLAISNCSVTTPLGFCIFSSLRKLALFRCSLHNDLERDDVGQQRFEVLLHSCSSLEILSIEDSTILPQLIIKAPNKLKQLTINRCKTYGVQIIHAPKLESLECHIKCAYLGSERCKLSVATAPCLKHFQLEFEFYPNRRVRSSYTLEKLSKTAPNLETLILRFGNTTWIDSTSSNVLFHKLRHLVLVEGKTLQICSAFWICKLLKSAPLLESLEIDIRREHHWIDTEVPSDFSHDNLKELKINGYQGGFIEFEIKLILCMLQRVTRLERVIISFDITLNKQWLMKEKSKVLERIRGGINSNLLIIFT